ncbi:FAD:protein FMN transferase [Sphingobacterium corticibacter]|uniref:FAD:protein FMN transferase n=1 Tax=Sphingobacterium corticibacter TaxID=2171749 RepID=A0A2T8HMT0_9SPHI|nr:FAD:protein FMN transferase [Sphingobacterium corticibacter]PVH26713.1 FAD:protein FMN transferase [Sphingobacterium corticibacter]
MRRTFSAVMLFFLVFCSAQAQQKTFFITGRAQGTTYQIQYLADREVVRKSSIDSVMGVIDQSMSLYQPHSLISMFNRQYHHELEIDTHMANVLREAFQVYEKSNGLFDVTVKPLVDLWGFGSEGVQLFPPQATVDSVLSFVGMEKIWLEGNQLHKRDPRTAIDLNGIAQGYTVDVLSQWLDERIIDSYLVEVGGEIRTKGLKAEGKSYEIAIERPEGAQSSSFVLQLTDLAVTTSGNYRKVAYHEGKKVHHHIDPKSGFPLQNIVVSATIIAPTAMEADAYDNVFMALSPQAGIALANRLAGIEVYIIYEGHGAFHEAYSDGFLSFVKP